MKGRGVASACAEAAVPLSTHIPRVPCPTIVVDALFAWAGLGPPMPSRYARQSCFVPWAHSARKLARR
eukprot:4584727-Alexandrium_andersonii.AAC.1